MVTCRKATTTPSCSPFSLFANRHSTFSEPAGAPFRCPTVYRGTRGGGRNSPTFFLAKRTQRIPPGATGNADSRAKTNPKRTQTNPKTDPKTPKRTQTNPKRTQTNPFRGGAHPVAQRGVGDGPIDRDSARGRYCRSPSIQPPTSERSQFQSISSTGLSLRASTTRIGTPVLSCRSHPIGCP